MKRVNRLLLFIVIVCTIMSGVSCTKKSSTTKKDNTDELKGSISILSASRDAEALKYAAESFTKKNPLVSISVKVNDKIETDNSVINSGESPDILVIKDIYAKKFIKDNSEKLADISELTGSKDKYPKWKISNVSNGGVVYGCPWYTLPAVLYYRNDIFEKEKINPNDIKTWDDFITAAQKVNKDTNKKMFSMVTNKEMPFYKILFSQLRNGYVDKDGKPIFNTDAAASALKLLKKLQDNKIINEYDSYASLSCEIKNGNVACFILSSDGAKVLTNTAPEQKGLWSMMYMPAFEPGGNRYVSFGGSNFTVLKSSKNKELAVDFLRYMTEDIELTSSQVEKVGTFTANTEMYNLKTLNMGSAYFKNQNIWQMLANTERLTPEIYYSDNYGTIDTMVNAAVANIMAQKDDIKLLLEKLKSDVETVK